MDRQQVFIIDEVTLLEAIRKYGKGVWSKDYEYAASIWMKRFLENRFNEAYSIVFSFKPGRNEAHRNFNPTPEETIKILREQILEDTPVDFGLVKGSVDNHLDSAYAFQVKRFHGKSFLNFNQDLLKYIHKILNSFRPGDVSLLIIPDVNNSVDSLPIDINYLRINISVPLESFQGVYIMLFNKEPIVIQLWPLPQQ